MTKAHEDALNAVSKLAPQDNEPTLSLTLKYDLTLGGMIVLSDDQNRLQTLVTGNRQATAELIGLANLVLEYYRVHAKAERYEEVFKLF